MNHGLGTIINLENKKQGEKMKLLIINGHVKYKGVANGGLASLFTNMADTKFSANGFEVEYTNVEDYQIGTEISKLLEADYIMFHTPIYWFGLPWQTKKYLDEVFNVGLFEKTLLEHDGKSRTDASKQYGTAGKMKAKLFMTTSQNAPEKAFNDENQYLFAGRGLDDLLLPITTVFKFSGAEILPAFAAYDVMKNPDIENDKIKFDGYLNNLLKWE